TIGPVGTRCGVTYFPGVRGSRGAVLGESVETATKSMGGGGGCHSVGVRSMRGAISGRVCVYKTDPNTRTPRIALCAKKDAASAPCFRESPVAMRIVCSNMSLETLRARRKFPCVSELEVDERHRLLGDAQ